MRKYDRTPSSSRGASGLSAAYLEAELDEEEDYEHDDGGDGMTATERARAALARPRRIDEAAEVLCRCRLRPLCVNSICNRAQRFLLLEQIEPRGSTASADLRASCIAKLAAYMLHS